MSIADKILVIVLFTLLSNSANQAVAQEPESDTATVAIRSLLERALKRETGTHFVTTVLIAVDAAPDHADRILRTAVQLAPERLVEIRDAVAAAYPERPDLLAQIGEPERPSDEEIPVDMAEIESPAAADEETTRGFFNWSNWDGKLELGASKSSGDTDETAISLGFELSQVIGKVWDHRLTLVGDYTRRQGVTTRERVDTDYQLYYRAWDRAYLFSFSGFEYDRFGGFDYRVTQAVGGGYTILKNERMAWSVEAGPGLRWVQEDTGASNFEFVGRANSEYEFRLNERVTLSNDTSFFIGTNRSTLENTAAVESNLTGALGLKLSFFVRHDTEAPAGTAKTDTITRANLIYDF